MNKNELMDTIINFEVNKNMNDTALAFASHLSVEKIHSMKLGDDSYTSEEIEQVLDYIHANS